MIKVYQQPAKVAGSCNACGFDAGAVNVVRLRATGEQEIEVRLCLPCSITLRDLL